MGRHPGCSHCSCVRHGLLVQTCHQIRWQAHPDTGRSRVAPLHRGHRCRDQRCSAARQRSGIASGARTGRAACDLTTCSARLGGRTVSAPRRGLGGWAASPVSRSRQARVRPDVQLLVNIRAVVRARHGKTGTLGSALGAPPMKGSRRTRQPRREARRLLAGCAGPRRITSPLLPDPVTSSNLSSILPAATDNSRPSRSGWHRCGSCRRRGCAVGQLRQPRRLPRRSA